MSTLDCTCPPVDPSLWTTHYGAVDPATTHEFDPICHVHGYSSQAARRWREQGYSLADRWYVCRDRDMPGPRWRACAPCGCIGEHGCGWTRSFATHAEAIAWADQQARRQ